MFDFIQLKARFTDFEKTTAFLYPDFEKSINERKFFRKKEFEIGPITIFVSYSKLNNTYTESIEFSLHKLFNYLNDGKARNHNRFPFWGLVKVVNYLDTIISIQDYNVSVLEIGLNVFNPIFDVHNFIDTLIRHRKANKHSSLKTFNNTGIQRVWAYVDYLIKFYDKAAQVSSKNKILRVEIRFKYSKCLKKYNVDTLYDLLDPIKLTKLYEFLRSSINDFYIVDNIDLPKVATKNEKYIFYNSISPDHLKKRCDQGKFGKELSFKGIYQRKHTLKKSFLKVLERYNLNTYKNNLLINMDHEWSIFQESINTNQVFSKSDIRTGERTIKEVLQDLKKDATITNSEEIQKYQNSSNTKQIVMNSITYISGFPHFFIKNKLASEHVMFVNQFHFIRPRPPPKIFPYTLIFQLFRKKD